jgi:hypothetical protein
MPESRYRGYEPPYDQLPSKKEDGALKGKDGGSNEPAGCNRCAVDEPAIL